MKLKLLLIAFITVCSLPLSAQDATAYVLNPDNPWAWQAATIEEATYVLQPKGFYTLVDVYLTFSARDAGFSDNEQLEVVLDFKLPEKAMVIDSWLWVEDVIIKAKILDRWTASGIYEEIVGRRQDPSILFKNSATDYQLRIYPMLGNGSRKVKISLLIPSEWTNSEVQTFIPTNLLLTSFHPVQEVFIRNFPEPGWSDLNIKELSQSPFVAKTDSLLGLYQEINLPAADLGPSITLSTPAPFENGIYVSKMEDPYGSNYYQMAISPATVFDLPKTQSRKVMLLFDYAAAYSSLSQSQLLQNVRTQLTNNLLPTDSFNLMVSSLTIEPVSDTWLPASPQVIDSVFNVLGNEPIANYSSIPSLLGNGIQFISEKNSGGNLLLFANSDNEGSREIANQLIDDLMDLMPEGVIPISIYDFQDLGLRSYWINNRRYRGNEYFYENLTRLTAGNLVRQYNSAASFSDNISTIMESISSYTGTLDLYTTLVQGFCYNRFNISGSSELVNLNKPILQIGKYQGSFPFVVEAAGEYDGILFGETIEIAEADLMESDSVLVDMWAGSYIRSLERSIQDNSTISEIINRSIQERVLSLYTAFIALEPNLGGEPCLECVDQSGGEVVTDVEDLNSDSLFQIQAFPNPFRDRVVIQLTSSERLDLGSMEFAVFNALGQEVHRFTDIPSGSSNELRLEWNGSDRSGQAVAPGLYFFTIQTPEKRVNHKLIKLK
jgi:hypothetical protein